MLNPLNKSLRARRACLLMTCQAACTSCTWNRFHGLSPWVTGQHEKRRAAAAVALPGNKYTTVFGAHTNTHSCMCIIPRLLYRAQVAPSWMCCRGLLLGSDQAHPAVQGRAPPHTAHACALLLKCYSHMYYGLDIQLLGKLCAHASTKQP